MTSINEKVIAYAVRQTGHPQHKAFYLSADLPLPGRGGRRLMLTFNAAVVASGNAADGSSS